MRRLLMTFLLTVCLIAVGFTVTAESASACPMCKAAAEKSEQAKNQQPKAYFYSIMFMLAVALAVERFFQYLQFGEVFIV